MDWKNLNSLERLLYRELLLRDAYFFVKEFWEEIDTHQLKDSDMLRFFCEVFQYNARYWVNYTPKIIDKSLIDDNAEVIDVREDKHLLSISCPPRHGKSNLFNILLPCWLFVNCPIKIASVSHTSGLAGTMNSKRQKLLNSAKFKFFFPEIDLVTNTAFSLKDTRGGEMYSIAKNSITGFGCDILLIDDLTNVLTAVRDAQEMESSWNTYTEVLPSRINDPQKHVIINIMQRIAPNDIVGRIKSGILGEAYTFVTLPAQFNHKTQLLCPISGKVITYDKDSYLFPEQFGNYDTIKCRISDHTWKAQYLQQPENSDLAVVKEHMIIEKDEIDVPPIEAADMIYASHDFPVKDKDTSDFLGSLLGYRVGSTLYLIDCLEKRLAFVKSVSYVEHLDEVFPGIIQVIEDKANGSPILQQLQDKVAGMQAYQPGTASKMQRLESASLYLESKNVVFVRTIKEGNTYKLSPQLQNLKERLLQFPFVEHDDIVDAFSMLILFVFMDRKYMVYGRSFNDENVCDCSGMSEYSNVFFNREGDIWKICEIAIKYGAPSKLYVKKEYRFRGSVENGIKVLKKFGQDKRLFIDCSVGDGLKGFASNDVTIEKYSTDDFEKAVSNLNLAFSKKLVNIDRNCVLTKSDIESFKFSKTKDDTAKFATVKDGFVACLRTAMKFYGGVV